MSGGDKIRAQVRNALADLHNWQNAPVEATKAAEQLQAIAQTPECKNIVREEGGLPLLVAPLREDCQDELAAAAACAIQNLVRGNAQNRDVIREADGIRPLIAFLKSAASHDLEEALRTISELACDNRPNVEALRNAEGIPPVAAAFRDAPMESQIKQEALATLLNIACASTSTNATAAIGQAGAIPDVLEMVRWASASKQQYVKMLSIELLVHLTKETENRRVALQCGILEPLLEIASSPTQGAFCRGRAADSLENLAHVAGAFGFEEAMLLTQALLAGLVAPPTAKGGPPTKAKKAEAGPAEDTAADLVQLTLTLKNTLKMVLAAPRSSAVDSGDAPSASSSQATDGAAVAAPSEVKPKSSEGGGGALHAWKTARRAVSMALDAMTSDKSSFSEVECGVMNAVMALKEMPTLLSLRQLMGDVPANQVASITEQLVATAVGSKDMMNIIRMIRLARKLPIAAEVLAEAEDHIKDHAEEASACEDAIARSSRQTGGASKLPKGGKAAKPAAKPSKKAS